MRVCACLWGGMYNPIIPVYRRTPAEWRPERWPAQPGAAVARRYISFFEPDVYVEAEEGLLERAGLGALRPAAGFDRLVMTLREFTAPEDGRPEWEPPLGLSVSDAIGEIYTTERRFVLREPRRSLLVAPDPADAAVEALFGAYPQDAGFAHFRDAYRFVFEAERVPAGPGAWRRAFVRGRDPRALAFTPLLVTAHGLHISRGGWAGVPTIHVFDPARPTDLIDLWNARLFGSPMLPVPVGWLEPLAEDLRRLAQRRYKQVLTAQGARMPDTIVQFGGSIPAHAAAVLHNRLRADLPQGALTLRPQRTEVPDPGSDIGRASPRRVAVTAGERRTRAEIREVPGPSASFETLAPEFAERYGRGTYRWVNSVVATDYARAGIATALPFNTFDRSWPHLGIGPEPVSVGSEGWAFPQRFRAADQWMRLMTEGEALGAWLERAGFNAELSEPGRIAREVIDRLGGLGGLRLIADKETLDLLSKMAGGVRTRRRDGDQVEETFGLRTVPIKGWQDLIARRRERQTFPAPALRDFTERNVIRLGLETDCPHCRARNWNTLTAADYTLTCERCLKPYPFPEAEVREQSRNFTYRVTGPFSTPDYGRGSYGALLALRALWGLDPFAQLAVRTASNVTLGGRPREVDFIAWRASSAVSGGPARPPQLIVGESKSFGTAQLIKPKDTAALRGFGAALPGSVIVVSVLRDRFLDGETALLRKLAAWGRRPDAYTQPSNPVILLTGKELLMEDHSPSSWRPLGDAYADYARRGHITELLGLADATQRHHLGMRPFHEDLHDRFARRAAGRAAQRTAKADGDPGTPDGAVPTD